MKAFFCILPLFFLFQAHTAVERPSTPEICLSGEEKKLYDLIMAYRKTKGLPAIPLSAKLTQVAQTHARDLSENYTFDPKNKCNPHSWSKNGTWTSCCYTADHAQAQCMWDKPKEIAGYDSEGYEIAYYGSAGSKAEEALEGWKKSQGHNPLIINSDTWSQLTWKGIGIGMYKEYGLVWFGALEDTTPIKVCIK
jgi:uncharacterized protein YkwD